MILEVILTLGPEVVRAQILEKILELARRMDIPVGKIDLTREHEGFPLLCFDVPEYPDGSSWELLDAVRMMDGVLAQQTYHLGFF